MKRTPPDVFVANMHKRFTGISATIRSLVPVQRGRVEIGVVDTGGLGLGGEWTLRELAIAGFRRPAKSNYRVWHARRAVEMMAGVFLRDVLRQRWKLVFTAASKRKPGTVQGFLINRMDAVIGASRFSASLQDWCSMVILHGVDCELFRPREVGDDGPAEARFAGRRAVGLVARIRAQKGSDLFVDAMLEVLPDHPDSVAVLIGSCRPEHEEFKASLVAKAEAAGLGDRVIFIDELDQGELAELYREMEICVACARNEGFGLTPLEAFACGTPVIATRTGAWPDLIDGEVGALVDVGDTAALARELDRLLSDPDVTRSMGKAARERAVQRHSIENEAFALVEVYRRLMKGESIPKSVPDADV